MKERKKKSNLLNFEVSKDGAWILSWGVEVIKKNHENPNKHLLINQSYDLHSLSLCHSSKHTSASLFLFYFYNKFLFKFFGLINGAKFYFTLAQFE